MANPENQRPENPKKRITIRGVLDALRSPNGSSEHSEHDFSKPFVVGVNGVIYQTGPDTSQIFTRKAQVDELELFGIPEGVMRVVETPNPVAHNKSTFCRIITSETRSVTGPELACYVVAFDYPGAMPRFVGRGRVSDEFPRIVPSDGMKIGLPAGTVVADFIPLGEQTDVSGMDSVINNPTAEHYRSVLGFVSTPDSKVGL